MTALKSLESVDGLLRVRAIGGFGGLIRNSLSSSLGTVHQIVHRALRIPHHRLASRLDKPVVAISPRATAWPIASRGGSGTHVRKDFTSVSRTAKRACWPLFMRKRSRDKRSSVAAIRCSDEVISIPRPATSLRMAARMNVVGFK